jgi:hypothetical protein
MELIVAGLGDISFGVRGCTEYPKQHREIPRTRGVLGGRRFAAFFSFNIQLNLHDVSNPSCLQCRDKKLGMPDLKRQLGRPG